MSTPSEELRTAAAKLRTLAEAASTDNDGKPTAHWHTEPCWPKDDDGTRFLYGDYLARDDGRRVSWPLLLRGGRQQHQPYMHAQHAEYAAAMDPTVGLALAELLDTAAEYVVEGAAAHPTHLVRALAVARAVLGGQQPPAADPDPDGRHAAARQILGTDIPPEQP